MQRLILRPFRLSDTDAMYRVFGDAAVMRFGYGVQSKEWVRDWLRFRILEYKEQARSNVWVVVEKANSVVIGYCGLFYIPDISDSPETEIGYRFIRGYWGQGYATEAAFAVRDYTFNQLGIVRLIAMIDPNNIASLRVAVKLGMRYEKDIEFKGYTHPDHVYVIEKRNAN